MAKVEIKKVEKPWGYELIWAKSQKYAGKILHINKGQKLSLQHHKVKEETILVFRGKIEFIYENKNTKKLETVILSEGEAHHIEPLHKHRMIAIEDSDLFEVSTPELDDVVRFEDSYGRAPGN
ncbi:MAG: cupin [Proteobacteria bacterium SG_bin7]|nr:MAG: cupin [Proteobacteria bacterium SG_bin7]